MGTKNEIENRTDNGADGQKRNPFRPLHKSYFTFDSEALGPSSSVRR